MSCMQAHHFLSYNETFVARGCVLTLVDLSKCKMEDSANALSYMEELLGESVRNTEDSSEENKEYEEEEDLVEENIEQGVSEPETPVLLMDLANKKKVKVSSPPPYKPIPTGAETNNRDRWLLKGHLGPPADFAIVHGLHHKIPKAPLPMLAP